MYGGQNIYLKSLSQGMHLPPLILNNSWIHDYIFPLVGKFLKLYNFMSYYESVYVSQISLCFMVTVYNLCGIYNQNAQSIDFVG